MAQSLGKIPMDRRERYAELVDLIDNFCRQHLNEEYFDICHDVVEICCMAEECPIDRGKAGSWAAGVVHAVGIVNFLFDSSQQPHIKSTVIAKGFGVSQATMQAKSKDIREGIDMIPLDPKFCVKKLIDDNPLVWLQLIDGIPVDMRYTPVEVQRAAFEMGLIPYVPAERKPS